jgi:REP element-mobilizing transposase RayT
VQAGGQACVIIKIALLSNTYLYISLLGGVEMARKPRIHYENAIYHVIVRGNNREAVFTSDEQKRKYLSMLADYKRRYDFELCAYVIMNNHAHLLIKVKSLPLAKIMQGLQQRYTQYYNHHFHRTGHVFEQRYKAFLCTNDSYLITLLCYIHQNPVRAKIKEAFDYRWSSHQAYYTGLSGFVDIDFILDILHTNRERAASQYCSLIGVPINKPDFTNEPKSSCQTPLAKPKQLPSKITWEELINDIAATAPISLNQIFDKSRTRSIIAIRKQLIYIAIENNLLTRQQLSQKFSIDPSRITRLYYDYLNEINAIPQA